LFSSEKLHTQLLDAVEKLGFMQATPVQEKVLPIAMQGHDLLVSAKTGSGKTAAFLLAGLNKLITSEVTYQLPRFLILLPTRELALQTLNSCEQLAQFSELDAALIIGGEDFKRQLTALTKKPQILIATPGRLVEHLTNNSELLSNLDVLVLDEADRMLEMGFSDNLLKIVSLCNDKRQTLLFSATLKNNAIKSISDDLLNNPQLITLDNRREAPTSITQQIILADDIKHKQELVIALLKEDPERQVIVFCNTRSKCRQLGNFLLYKDIKADFLHGDISQRDRTKAIDRFWDGDTQVLVATDLAARGLDIDVFVVSLLLPMQ